jgi:hypothetical protein
VIINLPEGFLYEKLPEGLVDLDARGVIQAVVGGYSDRIDDLRSYSKKLELLFSSVGLPETGDNVVLVEITSEQGKVYTRSLDLQSDTPPDGTAALFTWVLKQLETVSADRMANVRYGRDLLRLVDTNTLDYLAQTVGAVLYQSSALSSAEQQSSNRQLVATYFNRLRIKGTAESFNVLGRILGFDDVMVTPLFGRLSAHRPNDIGNPANDDDFKAEPDYYPQQEIDAFYDPNVTNDGPFYSWSGTVSHGTASTEFYTQVINGFNPWIEALVLNVQHGTVVDPANGSYALGSSGTLSEGGPHKKAFVEPPGADIMFRAIAEGESFNGIEVNVADSGTNKLITVTDRLSAVKYRSSYFDLALTAEFDRVEELYGDRAVRRNKDLAANPELTSDGTAVSPYRPWSAGSISTGSHAHDFLMETGTNAPSIIVARVQSAGTNRELNLQSFTAAGVQVTQALEEVRAATRFPRRAGAGFLLRDDVGYAAYEKETLLFTTDGTQTNYAGTNTDAPAFPYIAEIALDAGTVRSYATAAERPADSNVYDYLAEGFSGSFNFQVGTWAFVASPPSAGTEVFALRRHRGSRF